MMFPDRCLRWIICEWKNKIFHYYSLLINHPFQLEFLARRQSVFLYFIELAGFVSSRPIFLLTLLTYGNQLLLHNCLKMTTNIHTHISVLGIAFCFAYIYIYVSINMCLYLTCSTISIWKYRHIFIYAWLISWRNITYVMLAASLYCNSFHNLETFFHCVLYKMLASSTKT